MYKAPKQGEPQIIKCENKEWNWCKYHKKWVVKYTKCGGDHTSDTCLLNPKNKGKSSKKGGKKRVEVDAHLAQDDDEGVDTNSDDSKLRLSEEESSDDES